MNQSLKNSLADQWSSKWSFILAATGAAVGLGNIWRFPYMAGMNGGSAFVIVYIICVILIGLPIMMAEILIGRRAAQNPVDAMSNLAKEEGHSHHWSKVGWLGIITLLIILSFYSVVSGWSIAYIVRSISNQFYGMTAEQISDTWQHFLASPWQMITWHGLFMILTMMVIAKGVQQGLERAAKIMMPALYLILAILVGYAAIFGDFKQAIVFLFHFDIQKMNSAVVISAMGHAFFTLALGAGAMLMYGAYVPKKISITQAVFWVAGLDVLVAILSGLAIFPLVFSYHLPPQQGPGLMFQTLPIIFAHLNNGAIIGALFFILLLFAAWTSSVNLAEPIVVILMKRAHLSRNQATLITGISAWTLGLVSAFSFNIWKNVKIFNLNLFDITTGLPNDILLPIGGLGFAIFAGWIMKRSHTQNELNLSRSFAYELWRILIRYLAPIAILVIFSSSFLF